MKTILVTGGAGFIGSHLVDRLLKEKYKVIVIDKLSTGRKENLNPKARFYRIDICSPKISGIFKKEKPEVVFHYAAQINIRKSLEDPIEDARINILGTLNILENCRKYKARKLIFSSSGGSIYGETNNIPTPENQPENPESPYAISKLVAEKYLNFYKRKYNLDYGVLRYANIYGPRQNPQGEAGVIAIFINKLLNNKNLVIYGDGKQTRDYVYITDAVEAAILLLKSSNLKKPIFNVGTGIETSVNQLYKLISKKVGKGILPKFASAKTGDLKRSCLNNLKIKRELGWKPTYDLNGGIEETIKWFLDQKRLWRNLK